jgi:UDPglucose--hexose-1-phosphate uridylyltransferase
MLLKDPIVDRWVLITPGRDARPGARLPSRRSGTSSAECAFCPGHEAETPPETWSDRTDDEPDSPGWRVRVFPNKYPAIPDRHEVIVESPRHDADLATLTDAEMRRVLEAYASRIDAMAAHPDVRYVQLFRNAGMAAGATQAHPHAQLIGLPIVPPAIVAELKGAAAVRAQRGRCAFCEEVERASAEERRIIETEGHVALSPPAPRVPYETWVLPRVHAERFGGGNDVSDLSDLLGETTRRLAHVLDEPAYNLLLHHAPCAGGTDPGAYHWHLELLPRTSGIAGFELASGVHLNAVSPADAARALGTVRS